MIQNLAPQQRAQEQGKRMQEQQQQAQEQRRRMPEQQ